MGDGVHDGSSVTNFTIWVREGHFKGISSCQLNSLSGLPILSVEGDILASRFDLISVPQASPPPPHLLPELPFLPPHNVPAPQYERLMFSYCQTAQPPMAAPVKAAVKTAGLMRTDRPAGVGLLNLHHRASLPLWQPVHVLLSLLPAALPVGGHGQPGLAAHHAKHRPVSVLWKYKLFKNRFYSVISFITSSL